MNIKPRYVIITIIVLVALWLIGNVGSPASVRADGPNLLTNPGFESDMTGWSTSGTTAADYSQTANPHTGAKNLAHWYGSAWTVTTYQTKTGLTNGTYRFKAWIKNWGVTTAYLKAENCGGSTQTTNLPVSSTYVQVEITSISVTNTQCTVGVYTSSNTQSIAADDFEFYQVTGPTNTPTRTNTPGGATSTPTRTNTPGGATSTPTRTNTPGGATSTPTRTPTRTPTAPPGGGLTMRGADVSTLQRSMDLGQVYYNAGGTAQNALDILQAVGVNYIRLRVWVNPVSGYNNQAKVVAFAPSIKSRGMKLLIDFHYSDTWADPGKQYKPAAWASHNLNQLKTDVYNHTLDVCNALKAAGATPDMIQVGNEITQGMLWDEGKIVNNNFTGVSSLIQQGYNAVKACDPSIQVALHIDKGGDNAAARWWFDGVQAQGAQWDITALSYYCFWHGSMSSMQSNVADMKARYNKPVIIAETAYSFSTGNADSEANVVTGSTPCSGYPANWTGQANNFTAVQNAARAGGATGVFYWEPTWVAIAGNGWDPANINGTGNQWDNMAVFDWTGHVNPNIVWTQ